MLERKYAILFTLLISIVVPMKVFATFITYSGTMNMWDVTDQTGRGTADLSLSMSDQLYKCSGYFQDTDEIVTITQGQPVPDGLYYVKISDWSVKTDVIGDFEGNGGGIYFSISDPSQFECVSLLNNGIRIFMADTGSIPFINYWDPNSPNYFNRVSNYWLNPHIDINNHNYGLEGSVAPVPEPTTILLLGSGLLGLAGFRKKLKK
jgi:hypothetical protein